ncbi:Glycyl-tRNA synthetase 2, chloroplastic/mitochondrial [Hordeum vulgare]|nr:Glycyl-tRNA synthetase 2, chloroplastic/mitochondrial [Hordeum vulgare]
MEIVVCIDDIWKTERVLGSWLMDGRYGFVLQRLTRGGVPDLEIDGVSGVLPQSDSFNENGFILVSPLGGPQSCISTMGTRRSRVRRTLTSSRNCQTADISLPWLPSMVDLTQPPLPADLVFPWLHGVTDNHGSGWRHAGAPVKPCAPFWKLPNATMAKKGKVSEKKNKAVDGSSRQPKKRLAGHAKDAAATEAPANSLAASAADAHNAFDEMPSSFNDETYMSTMGVGSNNSHWSQTNEVHFDDHEFEVDEDGEGIMGATKGSADNYTMDEDVLLWRVAAEDRKVALEEKKLAMEGRTWLTAVLAVSNVQVETAESYLHTLEKAGIVIDMQERSAKILDDSSTLAKGVDGDFIAPDSLLQEVVNIVEAPVPILGRYDDSFLELPKDVLTTVMQKHQRYFPVISKSTGDLLPYFITVANGSISEEVVRKGNEAVLRARYEDAKFFYKMDTQKNLSEFRGQLKSILFHEKLGTMLDKMVRVENVVAELTLVLGINERMIPVVKDAATLAMSDLATSIVTEFTSLAGIMARHYALRDGLPEQIAKALFEITLPRFSGDVFLKTDAGIVLAVADRLDSLVGLFGAGCQPSSSNDPFGLRRISYGLVRENKKNFDLTKALTLMAEVQPIRIDSDIINEVVQFVTRRLEQLLVDEGINCEIVRSVLMERANCPYLASQTAAEMEAFSRTKDFPKIVEAYSRPVRIIRGKKIESAWEVDASVFENDEEKALWSAYLEVANKIHTGVDVKTFAESSLLLIQPLEDFFNNVFVMAEDEKIRNNRLALLQKVASLTKGIADLSVLPGF